jgi:hypothetical protein
MRKVKDSDPDPYLVDPDPEGPKTDQDLQHCLQHTALCRSRGFSSSLQHRAHILSIIIDESNLKETLY